MLLNLFGGVMSKDNIAKMLGLKIRMQRESHKMTIKQTATLSV